MSSLSFTIATPLLRPLIGLAGWTFVMEIWMYATRIPAIYKYNLSSDPAKIENEMKTKIPPHIRWKADNYNHLHEQPQVFYAVAATLALLGDDNPYTLAAAWGYVGVRVVHSLVQAIVNKIMVRFQLFAFSSVVLAGLTARAAYLLF